MLSSRLVVGYKSRLPDSAGCFIRDRPVEDTEPNTTPKSGKRPRPVAHAEDGLKRLVRSGERH